jgi:hypothetical protein
MKLLLCPVGKEKRVAVLKAYFDESGIQDGAKYCVIAGFVASTRRWSDFERKYRSFGVADAQDPGFHGKRFFVRDPKGCKVSPYKDWTDERLFGLLKSLVDAIASTDVTAMAAYVDIAAFGQYSEEERRYLTGSAQNPRGKWELSGAPGRPYFLAFQSVLMRSLTLIRRPRPGVAVNFVFDRQETFSGFAQALYEHAAETSPTQAIRNQLGGLLFESRQTELPLQAADMLAHATYRTLHTDARTGVTGLPEIMGRIFRRRLFIPDKWGKEEMDKYLRDRRGTG